MSKAGTFPFISGSSSTELFNMYHEVSGAMEKIHTTNSSSDKASFSTLCGKW